MVPKGIILDCLCVLLGTNLGSAIKNHIPARINQPMNVIFGLSAIAIGITSVVKLHSLPAVILAFILGGLIGEAVNLDDKIKSLFQRILERLLRCMVYMRPAAVDISNTIFIRIAITVRYMKLRNRKRARASYGHARHGAAASSILSTGAETPTIRIKQCLQRCAADCPLGCADFRFGAMTSADLSSKALKSCTAAGFRLAC